VKRREFIGLLAGAFALDPERLLWTPGKKLISIPKAVPFRALAPLDVHVAELALILLGAISHGQTISGDEYDYARRIGGDWDNGPIDVWNLALRLAPGYDILPHPQIAAIALSKRLHRSREQVCLNTPALFKP
jgi:hypothetical protein